MFNNTVIKVSMLAAAVALTGCANDEGTPVAPPVTPPSGDVLVVMDDGVAAGGFSVLAGSQVDYSKNVLAVGETYTVAGGITVSPSTNGDDDTWKVDTFGSGEAYIIIGEGPAADGTGSAMDMTPYANGVLIFDILVTSATATGAGNYSHQIVMQTNGGTTSYLDRNIYFFDQDQLAAQESAGWKTISVPMSCFSPDAGGNFDITKVHELFRLDVRNESVTYELGTVKYDADATMIPEGAVEWTCG